MKKGVLLFLLLSAFSLSACGGSESGAPKMDYDQTKKMVVDILQTDDGKKAIKELMADEEMKQHIVLDSAAVKDAVEGMIVSGKGEEFWKKAMKDPKFAKAIGKSLKKEHEQVMKDLMKDPQYQGLMLNIMSDPEFQKEITKTLKSKEMRQHMQDVVGDTMDSPLYKAKIEDILIKAATEMKDGKDKGKEKKDGSGEEGGS